MFFFNATATTEIYTLSLHDALPIYLTAIEPTADGGYLLGGSSASAISVDKRQDIRGASDYWVVKIDRKSTCLNSSHANISYAVFCLKKKYIQCSAVANSDVTRRNGS